MKLPLLKLYLDLRAVGILVSIDDYYSLLKSMCAGFGIYDLVSLKNLCLTLWVKRQEDIPTFEYCFRKYLLDFEMNLIIETSKDDSKEPINLHEKDKNDYELILFSDIREKVLYFSIKIIDWIKKNIFIIFLLGSIFFLIGILTIQSQKYINFINNRANNSFDGRNSWAIDAISIQQAFILAVLFFTLIFVGQLFFEKMWSFIGGETQLRFTNDKDFLNSQPSELQREFLARPKKESKQESYLKENYDYQLNSRTDNATLFDESAMTLLSKNSPRSRSFTSCMPVSTMSVRRVFDGVSSSISNVGVQVLDVRKTIQKISKDLFFTYPIYKKSRVSRLNILLLLDQDGSMIPFHPFTDKLVALFKTSSSSLQAKVFYFQNLPGEYIYLDKELVSFRKLSNILRGYSNSRTMVIIFSDAGAARGTLSNDREMATYDFLDKIKNISRVMIWLNPLPEERWNHSTAERIARFAPMFESTEDGFSRAVDFIRDSW
ncbi:MAG: hypothetical protein AAFZ35_05140 [Cyanobacteria bacterium J06649_12]